MLIIMWVGMFLLTTILMLLSIIINKKSLMDREKSSPFECGFDPQNSSRVPFSMRFFIITLIFLIFDVEIALLLPLNLLDINVYNNIIIMFFIALLVLGLFYEWKEGALTWL